MDLLMCRWILMYHQTAWYHCRHDLRSRHKIRNGRIFLEKWAHMKVNCVFCQILNNFLFFLRKKSWIIRMNKIFMIYLNLYFITVLIMKILQPTFVFMVELLQCHSTTWAWISVDVSSQHLIIWINITMCFTESILTETHNVCLFASGLKIQFCTRNYKSEMHH